MADYRNKGNQYGGNRRNEKDYAVTVTITEDNYVDEAEKAILDLNKGRDLVSASKIRNILSMVSDLYNEVRRLRESELDRDSLNRLQYIRMRCAYEAGREEKVRYLIQRADILNNIKAVGKDKEKCLTFCRYMEALVAYHRYHGGRVMEG